jgi:hypothetical protein
VTEIENEKLIATGTLARKLLKIYSATVKFRNQMLQLCPIADGKCPKI